MINSSATRSGLSASGVPRPRAAATAVRSIREGRDGSAWIEVDAPARAARRAEALRRTRQREQAILQAFGGGRPEPQAPHQIAIQRWPAPAPALDLIPDAQVGAGFPSLTFNFITGLLACSMLGWLTVWVVLRFCQ